MDAFDLRVRPDGVVIAYAAAGALWLQRLDRGGDLIGDPRYVSVVGGRVRALVAGASAGRAVLAWLRVEGGEAHVEASMGNGRSLAFGPPVTLDHWSPVASSAGALGERDLALRVTPTGAFRLLHRAAPMPCGSGMACATFGHSDLDGSPSQRVPRPTLAAEDVCPWPLPGVVDAGGRTYYGLCTVADGQPRTTLYMLQPEPQYAQADPALEGCEPLGVLATGEHGDRAAPGALFAADCPSGREVVRLAEPGVSPTPLGGVLPPSCGEEHPALHVGAMTLPLATGRDRLEGFLPSTVAPARSRVAWTGEVFVVAALEGRTLTARSLRCDQLATTP
ncbi:MAG: hypothetical protein KC668_17595 [Myxococcales bacterium]|nr:hypothetical protein [Myxococcales bacterium]